MVSLVKQYNEFYLVCKIYEKGQLRKFMTPLLVLSMMMLSFIFVIVCGLLSRNECMQVLFIIFGDPSINRVRSGIPITGLSPPHMCGYL